MSQNEIPRDERYEEVNFYEIFAIIWAHKSLIVFITGLFVVFSGYQALKTEKKFIASAIFQIEQDNNSSNFNLSGEFGSLAALVGFAPESKSSSFVLLERMTGREFILAMSEISSLERDPYFNTYNPEYKDPLWKAVIKKIIGWKTTELDKVAVIEHNVISNYRKNVRVKTTKSGAIEISVTHTNPDKASKYANIFMEEVRKLHRNESIAALDLRLNYLSETLADALQDMETAQEKLKNYALGNNAMAQENFIADSLKLDAIRMEKRKAKEIANLMSILEGLIESNSLDSDSYKALRSSHPLVDDIDFRRILGMSETISAWTWPEIETVEAVSATLKDRIKRLDVDIKKIEENAKIYATSAEDLAKLNRDAKIAEATYTVLIEQVKSQTLAAGFQPDTFRVYEYATPPLLPSSPNRKLFLLLGAVSGILVSLGLAFFSSIIWGVYYSRSALFSATSAGLALRSKPIKKLSQKSFSNIISFISKNKLIVLNEAEVKLANKKIIYVSGSSGKMTAANAARLLATQSAKSHRNVVLCDTTGRSEKESVNKPAKHTSELLIENISDNLNVAKGIDGASFFTSNNFTSTVNALTNQFDQVFICSSNSNAKLGLMALSGFYPSLVLIAGLRKTRKLDIQNFKKTQPIDILFYD